MQAPISPLVFSILLFVGMLVLLETGRRLGKRRALKEPDPEHESLSTIETAVFALFGLLIAFTFAGAATRFNEKRMLISDEANSIGTAYLRLQLLSQGARPELQQLFRRYVDSRLEVYRSLPDMEAARKEMANSRNLQEQIWNKAVDATNHPGSHVDAGKLLLPALNNMIDITTTRAMALQIHPPRIIYVLIFVLGLICSLLAGYRISEAHRSWVHIFAFTLITVIIVYVILDIEYPRAGLIRIETADQVLLDLRDGMN